MKKKYSIMAKGEKKAEVLIYDDIGAGWFGGVSAKDFAKDLLAMGKLDEINVRINSNGGSVFEGVAIYNTLVKNSARVVVDIDGIAASIASIIAMAGDEIRMAENSFMMIHDPWMLAAGTADELRDTASMMDKIRDTLLDTYDKRASASRDDISDWMAAETWLTADEAVDAGLVDSIGEELKLAAFSGFDLSKHSNVPESLMSSIKAADKNEETPRTHSMKSKMASMKTRSIKLQQSLPAGD